MIFRAAEPADASDIAALLNPIIRETTISFTTSPKSVAEIAEDIIARQQAGLPWIVASVNDTCAGYVTATPFRRGEGYAQTLEHSLFVAPSAARAGIGRALMHRLEETVIGAGVRSLVAGISAENLPAVTFHRQIGFTDVGRIARAGVKFGREIDLLLLQKHLSSLTDKG
ncbi:MAG: N-acetyltransferase family protein [Pseudomonadota bacterium]